jgi:hypothetical protein
MKIQIREAINYLKYEQLIKEDFFNYLIGLDPTAKKEYSQWIIHYFFKEHKNYIDRLLANGKLGNNPNDTNFPSSYTYPLSFDTFRNLMRYYDRQMILKRFFEEDSYKITENLKTYDLLKTKNKLKPEEKNIMNIKGFVELFKLLEIYSDEVESLEVESLEENSYDKWYEDSEWLANTHWCTTTKDDDSNFNYYSKQGPLIIIIEKNVKNHKWQLHFESDQWKDYTDREVDRTEFLNELPEDVKRTIFEHTKNFLFHPNKKEIYEKILNNQEVLREIFSRIDGGDLMNVWEEQEEGSHYRDDTFPFSQEALKIALYDYMSENINTEAYSYGYDNPWIYIKEEPEYKDDIEDCFVCDGTGFAIPRELSPEFYQKLEKGENERVNEILSPLEQKQFLSLYKYQSSSHSSRDDGMYIRINNDTDLAKKLNQTCKTCKGTGKEDTENADYYSDEQREEAGSLSEQESAEQEVKEVARNFYRLSRAEQTYSKKTVEGILDNLPGVFLNTNYDERESDIQITLEGVISLDENEYYKPNILPVIQNFISSLDD